MNGFKRPKVLPNVVPSYEHSWSNYPDAVRVSFENGQTLRYVVEVTQPEPVLGKMLDRFAEKYLVGGYKYKEKGRGKRTGRIKEADNNG